MQPFAQDFLLLLYHLLLVFLFSFFLLWIPYLHLLSVPGIQFSYKSFDNDIIEYYIGLPDLNSEVNTDVNDVKLSWESVEALQYVLIIVKISLGCKINKTTHCWCFLCH